MTDIKTRDSKGNIYDSCPFIDKIIEFLDTQIESANAIKVYFELGIKDIAHKISTLEK